MAEERREAHILVVEDDGEMRSLLHKVLSREGYQVGLASDGLEALEKLGENRWSLVISDWKMPRMDGLELLRRIRRTRASVPVILITAFGDRDNGQEALGLGASAYLDKPLKMAELQSEVKRALGLEPTLRSSNPERRRSS